MLVTTALAAVVAILFAATVPNRVRQHLDEPDRCRGVVALDHQLARPRTPFIGAVLNLDRETRARTQLCRKWIVQELPMTALSLEAQTDNVEGALANIADNERTIRAAPRVHATEARGAGDSQLPGRRVAADQDRGRARRIIGEHLDGCGFESEARGSETNRNRQEAARRDRQRIGEHLRHDEIGCVRSDPRDRQRAMAGVVEQKILVGEIADAGFRECAGVGENQAQMRRWTFAGGVNCVGPGRIVACDCHGPRLGAVAKRAEADDEVD